MTESKKNCQNLMSFNNFLGRLEIRYENDFNKLKRTNKLINKFDLCCDEQSSVDISDFGVSNDEDFLLFNE